MHHITNVIGGALVALINPDPDRTLPPWLAAVLLVALIALVGNASIGDFIY